MLNYFYFVTKLRSIPCRYYKYLTNKVAIVTLACLNMVKILDKFLKGTVVAFS